MGLVVLLLFCSGVVFIVMARSPDKIKSIDGSKETLKLSVRISDLWFIGTPNKSEQAEMVFVDSDGDEIHAACEQDQLKVCDHQFKLVFIGVTVVRECVLGDIPFRKYRFARFADVVAGQFERGLLVDVIGVVEEVVFRQVSGKGRRVVFKLKDLSQQLLSCTLWDDYCLQFVKFLDDYEGDGPITVLLSHCRIKEAQGSYPASINNSFKASKLAELGIEARSGFKSHGEGSTQLSGSIQLSSKESFFGKAEAKTIVEINTISEEIVCVTVGTITRIVLDNHSWCYTACIQCHKKSDAEMVPFTCAHGKHNKEVVLRYRLKVMINEGNESTKFLLWDRECSELIGQSADAVNKLKIEDGDVDLNASPQALDKLLGHELAFKIKVQPKFRNSIVLKCSADPSLINVVMDMLADAETSSKMDIPDFGVRLWFPVRDFHSSVVEELAGLCNFMARIPDKIRSIDGSKEMLKLAVRITDLWFVGTPNKSEQAEMVFVDSEFLSYLNECGDDGPMVIILTHARIKDAQGSYPASVSNSFKASKLLINDRILEIQEFKEKLLDLGVEVSRVLLPGDQASSQDIVCVTVGTISKIVMDNHSWCYPACAQCHRKTDIQTGPFTCGCGKDNDQPVLRYRVEVMVTQNNESSKFLLWDRECAELIGETADDVNRVKIELVNLCCFWQDGDLDLNASPQALDKLLGHVLAFKVRIQSKFKNAVVLRYSKDLDLINVVLEMLPDSEMFFSDIYFSRCCHDDMIHEFDYHQLIYADHDPVAGLPLTPKKRMSSDEADDELGSSQISPAQLSSNKLTRHSHKS
ncbi:Replication protein A DNA-binding subunit C [Glycine soja]